MKADTMNIELPPLPQFVRPWTEDQADILKAWGQRCASRSRAASEPGEVARLAEEARDLLLEALSAAESAGHPLNHGRSADANKARDELLAIIARLASAATSPASEALTPQQREDILVKAGAICDGGMSHDDFGLEIIDQVERHYGICAHGAGSISKS
jgi:hypothetical protein